MARIHAYTGTVTAGGTDGTRVSEGSTSIADASGILAGATTVTATDITKLQALTKLMIGSGANREIVTISSISGSVVTFTPAVANNHANGELLHYPLFYSLNSNGGEEKSMPVALRNETGFVTTGDVTVSVQDVVVDAVDKTIKFALANDNGSGAPGTWGAWGASLLLTNPLIGATNKLIHVKAMCVDGETNVNDVDVKIKVAAAVAQA